MKCIECEQLTDKHIYWEHSIYALEGTPKSGLKSAFCSNECKNKFLKKRSKWFDELDEVMNRNKHFIRTKGMEGNYQDGDLIFKNVSAYWKRGEIETYNYDKAPSRCKIPQLRDFQKWLNQNNLKYKYESR